MLCPGRYPGVQLVLALFGLSRLPTSLYVLQFCFYFWSTCTPAWAACSGFLSHSLPFSLPHPLIAATHTPGRQVADTLRVVCSCIRAPRVAHCVLGACEGTIRGEYNGLEAEPDPPMLMLSCPCPCPMPSGGGRRLQAPWAIPMGHSHGLSLAVRLCSLACIARVCLAFYIHAPRAAVAAAAATQHGLPVYATADISKGSSSSKSSLVGARFFLVNNNPYRLSLSLSLSPTLSPFPRFPRLLSSLFNHPCPFSNFFLLGFCPTAGSSLLNQQA